MAYPWVTLFSIPRSFSPSPNAAAVQNPAVHTGSSRSSYNLTLPDHTHRQFAGMDPRCLPQNRPYATLLRSRSSRSGHHSEQYRNSVQIYRCAVLPILLQNAADPGPLPIQCGCHPAVRAEALFRMAHSPPVTSLSPHSYGSRVVRYSLRLPVRTFNARLTSNAISMRSISVLVA